jgi:hypothetical protein
MVWDNIASCCDWIEYGVDLAQLVGLIWEVIG